MVTLGINFCKPKRKFEVPLQIATFLLLIVTTCQSLLFLKDVSEFGMPLANAVTIGLFDLQGSVKFFALLVNQRKLNEIREKLTEKIGLLTEPEISANIGKLVKFRKMTRYLVISSVSVIWLFNILPVITVIFFWFVKGVFVQLTPFSFWYPSGFKTNWFFPVYFYEIISGHAITATPLIIDAFFLLMLGQLIVLFDCIADRLKIIVNEFEAEKREDTVKKLKTAIDDQNALFDLSSQLMNIFEFPLLINVLAQTGTICFIAFIISTQGIDIAIPSLLGLANSLAQVFLLCWFGERIKSSVSFTFKNLKS